MPGPESLITADQSRQLLETAIRHLTEARKIRSARAPGDRGSAAEEAALLIALAQAEAVLSIAGQLANGVTVSRKTEEAIMALGDAAHALKRFGASGR